LILKISKIHQSCGLNHCMDMSTMHVACHRCCQGAPREGTPCELPRRGPHGALTGRWRGAARALLRYKIILPLRILGTVSLSSLLETIAGRLLETIGDIWVSYDT
jgi:hypothetical protein